MLPERLYVCLPDVLDPQLVCRRSSLFFLPRYYQLSQFHSMVLRGQFDRFEPSTMLKNKYLVRVKRYSHQKRSQRFVWTRSHITRRI